MSTVRQSIQPTYDSRETGPRFHVTYRINDRTITFQEQIADPFVTATLRISWLDRLKSLIRKDFSVTVLVGGDPEVVDDVLELDANHLGVRPSTRRQEWNSSLNEALGKFAEEDAS